MSAIVVKDELEPTQHSGHRGCQLPNFEAVTTTNIAGRELPCQQHALNDTEAQDIQLQRRAIQEQQRVKASVHHDANGTCPESTRG